MTKLLPLFGLLLASILNVHAFEPWTLERALEHALAHNPEARQAQQRIAIAQASLQQANAAFWPQLQLQSGYTRTDNPMLTFGSILNQRAYDPALNFNRVPDVDNLNVKGLLTAPLYAGGRHTANRAAAQARTRASKHDHDAVRNELGFEVVRAFHIALKTRQFVRATDAAVQALEASAGIARRRFDGGTLLKSDVLDVEVRLAQAREDLVRARNATALAERALRNLLGLADGEFAVAENAPAVAAPTSGNLSLRAELTAARERAGAAEAQVRSAKSGHRPRLSAFASVDYDRGWKFNRGGESYTAGIVAQWDLWDGQRTRGQVREAKANLELAREEERKIRLAVDYETEQARLDLQTAGERLALTTKAIEQAAESAKIARHRFEQGLALSTQLIDAETALVVARIRHAEAEADQRIAVAALRKAWSLPQLDPHTTLQTR